MSENNPYAQAPAPVPPPAADRPGYPQLSMGAQGVYATNSPQQAQAEDAANTSLILGIFGIFVFGIILGPLAIIQASKAERLGKAATAGKVLGWIATVTGALLVIVFAGTFAAYLTVSY